MENIFIKIINEVLKNLIPMIFTFFIGYTLAYKKTLKAVTEIQKIIAKKEIICIFNKYKKIKKIPLEEKLDLNNLYSAYKLLKGNGQVDTIIEHVKNWKEKNIT